MLPLYPMPPQTRTVLKHLTTQADLTPMVAAGVYKVRSLPRRVCDLKARGVDVRSELLKDATGQRYARYWIAPVEKRRVIKEAATKFHRLGLGL